MGVIGIFEPRVDFGIHSGRGFRNDLFGREGLLLATLTGPGRIWRQRMPILNFTEEIRRYLQIGKEGSKNCDWNGLQLCGTFRPAQLFIRIMKLIARLDSAP